MAGRFLRDNAFLVGAVSLPLVVVGVFLLLTAIPKWTVPPPQYDLLLHTTDYNGQDARITVQLFVRDEALQATLRPVLKDMHPPRVRLWRFDHGTLSAREIPVDLPAQIVDGEPPRTLVVEALRGRRIVTDTKAPDGYELRTRTHGGPGLIGDLFGMGRYDQSSVIVNRGRIIPIGVPTPNQYQTPGFLGWLLDRGER
ncbi:MAG: hypothetical protein H0W08_26565 [Acidobacteria bacterium]|nr:hypothetical protein [Acidobacteriota bacterium]